MNTTTIEPLKKDNWYSICQLSVTDEQKEYFSVPNVYWIGISRYEESSELFAIKFGGEYVGLIGGGLDPDEKNERIGGINPLMIDGNYQRKGIAKEAMRIFIDYLCRKYGVSQINIGHRKENTAASQLYAKLGFEIIEETEKGYVRCLRLEEKA